ncbi:type II toxin-antitoxin system PemK/MazF family toxin [Gandjariella thermophila]|uniref:Endoribonuclease MazF1 n=1 Tax=Gandjariella thermophila TaxID=1931992 RepID=A0A4D4J5D3_9PSEU|nr:type II toxin-antitoxin system PemK/MazF family toxin [Gandjariella thermophila]GDY29173.1 endoribonuclease MazF1 [Gandjariella thermophila]
MTAPVRGQVYRADLGYGPKPWVVVSNNVRNRQLDSVLAVRVTTTSKPDLPTIVRLGNNDPVAGRVLADDLHQLYPAEDFREYLGALSPETIGRLNAALAVALGLPS